MTSNRTQLIAHISFWQPWQLCLATIPNSTGMSPIRSWCLFLTFYFGSRKVRCRWCRSLHMRPDFRLSQWMFFGLLFHGGRYFSWLQRQARYLVAPLQQLSMVADLRTSFCPLFRQWLGCYLGHSRNNLAQILLEWALGYGLLCISKKGS